MTLNDVWIWIYLKNTTYICKFYFFYFIDIYDEKLWHTFMMITKTSFLNKIKINGYITIAYTLYLNNSKKKKKKNY